jgi:hypothetical protein
MPTVFRWNIARREQLGRLVDGEPADVGAELLTELRLCCGRVIAMAGDARLVFIGRSPEHLYDYLTGAFADTSWSSRLTLLNLSLKEGGRDWREPDSIALTALREQFAACRLAPNEIASSPYPIALVDLIYAGETFGKLTEFLIAWSADAGVDWRAVRRRIRIVGITERHREGPRTWRWRTLDWAARYQPSSLKGVSIPWWFWSHLGNSEKKVSRENPPARWGDPEMMQPPRGDGVSEALRVAVALHDLGRTRAERDALAAALSVQPAVQHAWCRTLAAELRAVSRPKRIERTFGSKQRVRSWRRRRTGRSFVSGR